MLKTRKYLIGGAASFSGSPLSTSGIPSNPFLMNLGLFILSLNKPSLSNAAGSFQNNMLPLLNNLAFRTGLLTSDSSNYMTAMKGRLMMLDAMLATSGSLGSFINPVLLKETNNDGTTFKAIGMGSDIIGSMITGIWGDKDEYEGEKGYITRGADLTYDKISDVAMSLGPVGAIVGGAMKAGSALGKVSNALGGGTDAMTTADSVMGSSFFNWNIGLINGFGGKKASTISKDDEAFETVGASYGGTNSLVDSAVSKSGKKYGLFSNRARKRANREIAEAKRLQGAMADIADDASTMRDLASSSSVINSLNREINLYGGYLLENTRVGRRGLKITPLEAKLILHKNSLLKKLLFLLGGTLDDPFQIYLNTLPKNQRDSTNYRVRDYWSFNGKPKNFEEAKQKGMFTLLDDGWHANSVAENPETGEIEFMKPSSHPTHYMEVDWYNSDDGAEFRSQYELLKTEPYWKYVKRTTEKTPIKKDGGSIVTLTTEIELVSLEDINEVKEFQKGGSINVIPDGALHARKHNMDIDGITKKGIPVVSEKDGGEIEQLAEIEKNEIIMRLEVTLKLEELSKMYYSLESSLKEKDLVSLEAGKLLVKEILYNTLDNTGLLNEI